MYKIVTKIDDNTYDLRGTANSVNEIIELFKDMGLMSRFNYVEEYINQVKIGETDNILDYLQNTLDNFGFYVGKATPMAILNNNYRLYESDSGDIIVLEINGDYQEEVDLKNLKILRKYAELQGYMIIKEVARP